MLFSSFLKIRSGGHAVSILCDLHSGRIIFPAFDEYQILVVFPFIIADSVVRDGRREEAEARLHSLSREVRRIPPETLRPSWGTVTYIPTPYTPSFPVDQHRVPRSEHSSYRQVKRQNFQILNSNQIIDNLFQPQTSSESSDDVKLSSPKNSGTPDNIIIALKPTSLQWGVFPCLVEPITNPKHQNDYILRVTHSM